MTSLLSPDTIGDVTSENPWVRLHRVADARRQRLHLTVDGIKGAGGPSAAWFRKLRHEAGPVSTRHLEHLEKLDAALQWPAGTSLGLLEDDRSYWSQSTFDAEEAGLIELANEDEFLLRAIQARLRVVSGDEHEQLVRTLARAIGLPVVGD